ncbi:MAG: C45 family autoproteolytic acyltransferase/hydrolase [Planctomycetota bacterium]|jgi:tetratricopeptide (TPR) repeat protein
MRKWLRRGLRAAAALLVLIALFVGWALLFCFAEPPELDYEPAARAYPAPEQPGPDGRIRFGPNWFLPQPGRSLLYVEGDPYSIGFANATLTRDYLEAQERSLFETVQRFFPSRLALYGIGLVVLVNNRNLPDYVDAEYQEEILGLSDAAVDLYPEFGPRYHRILNYHAAHDIGHWVHDKPVIGCTAFAVAGDSLLVGRNFDFEAGRVFDVNKIIGCYRPTRGHAFLSVAWPGMAGVVTGINSQRIYCSLNGAHSADRDNIGTPVSLVIRRVLQYAGTLDEAIAILEQAQVFVSDSYLLADGKNGTAAVVEKSPARTAIRRLSGAVLLQANHFECPEFEADEGNREYMAVGSSLKRRRRLAELVTGALTPAEAAAILRDTRGADGGPLSLGNRGAINPCIATHSIVADVGRGILWVSRGPHQLGAYDAYSIERFGEQVAPPIAASPLLDRYDDLVEARRLIEAGGRANFEEALRLNPGDSDALFQLGQLLEDEGEADGALERYRAALAAGPAFDGEADRIRDAIARLTRGS